MSAEDVELVRRSFAPWSQGDFARLEEMYTEDAVFHSAVTDLVGKTVVGHAALRELMDDIQADWSTVRWEIDDIFETERGVVSLHRVVGVGRVSGLEMTRELASVYEMRDGRIASEWVYLDRDEALAAAGPRK